MVRAPWNLYPHHSTESLDPALFAHPGSEYRGTPFWSWNNRLNPEQLCQQIEHMKTMGLGGFHMHPRTGLATDYMGGEFMAAVRTCVEKAKTEDMLAWLYDEDRFPSGAAGGLVTCDKRYRQKFLRFSPNAAKTNDNSVLLARYDIQLDSDACLKSGKRLADSASASENTWYAFCEISPERSWYNNQTYVDMLSVEAIKRFIKVTHETYKRVVGKDFGTAIPAIFTDEPQVKASVMLPHPAARQDCILPWTTDLPQTYQESFAEDLLDVLPELFWELPKQAVSRTRWRFREHIAERFVAAFSDQVGKWCQKHGIALTGHQMAEESLNEQTLKAADAMRHYRSYQLPGIDMLRDGLELTTAKQAVSVARQDGRCGVLSEIYGVTNWDFPFSGHKRQGDWQAALGVTVRAHHLYWVSMRGNAKRDYPAAIGHQSPWFPEYSLIEDHFARLNTALTRGQPLVRIGVIHPLESEWLNIGPLSQTQVATESLEHSFQNLTHWLLDENLDFDFISESLLPRQCKGSQKDALLHVGAMRYDAVVVPSLRTIRSNTLRRLKAFAKAGGRVIFAGRVPDHVEAQASTQALAFAKKCQCVELSRGALAQALDDLREVTVTHPSGCPIHECLYQLRQDEKNRWLFVCCHRHRKLSPNPWTTIDQEGVVRVRGHWRPTLWNTQKGTSETISYRHDGDWTEIPWELASGAHLLVSLEPATERVEVPLPALPVFQECARLEDPIPVTLHEPNVLLLSQAVFRLDDGPWQPRQEIMRAENILRQQCGWKPKTGAIAQPWCVPPSREHRKVTWQCIIDSTVSLAGCALALEQAAESKITLDGVQIPSVLTGWWTDESIHGVALPDISTGRHTLEVEQPFTPDGSLEWMYLLGDFGVELRGRHARLCAPVRELAWGDWTRQGLPFFAGNITYHAQVLSEGEKLLTLQVSWCANPLMTVTLNGHRIGAIMSDPFRLDLGVLPVGAHRLDITCFGNRINAFGAVHNCNPDWTEWGPDSWQSSGEGWSDGYRLWPQGITVAPRLLRRQE